MHLQAEAQILRALAVIALAAAILVAAFISLSSGIVGGAEGSSTPVEETITAPAGAAPENPGQEAPAPASAEEGDPASEASSNSNTYEVQDGDSFFSISRKLNIDIAEITKLNPNLDPSNLKPGTRITVPKT